MAVLKTTSPVVLPAAPMHWPLKIDPSLRASTAGAVTYKSPWALRLAVICEVHMHKAGGVLAKHPPALCGLTRYTDYRQKFKDPYRPCPRKYHGGSTKVNEIAP